MAGDRKTAVSYYDAVLYESDIHLLEPSQWLNDAILSFVFEYFCNDHSELKDSTQTVFLHPSTARLLLFLDKATLQESILKPIGAHKADVVLLPVNDGAGSEKANAGSHWALLAVKPATATSFYMDSFKSDVTLSIADKFSVVLHNCLGTNSNSSLIQVPFPQQVNHNDCGMYVIAAAELVGLHGISHETTFKDLTPDYIAKQRYRWKVLFLL